MCISVCDLNTTVFSHSKTHHLQSYMPTQSGCVSGQTAFFQVWREEGREEGREGGKEEGREEGRKGGRKGGRVYYLCRAVFGL